MNFVYFSDVVRVFWQLKLNRLLYITNVTDKRVYNQFTPPSHSLTHSLSLGTTIFHVNFSNILVVIMNFLASETKNCKS